MNNAPILHDEHTRAKVVSLPAKVVVHIPRLGETLKFTHYTLLKDAGAAVSMMAAYCLNLRGRYDRFINPTVHRDHGVARNNKLFTAALGITPSLFKRVFNAAMISSFEENVAGNEEDDAIMSEWIKRLCHPKTKFSKNFYRLTMIENKREIIQAHKDGLKNIIPLVAMFGKSPQKLKKIVGKGAWKRICKQSMTKNAYLTTIRDGHIAPREARIGIYAHFPTFILKHFPYQVETAYWLYKNGVFNYSSADEPETHVKVNRWFYITRDTMQMAADSGQDYDYRKYTPAQVERKHDELVEERNRLKYSPEPMGSLKNIQPRHVIMGEYEAVLLDSPKSIVDEGSAMHHCVGLYVDSCQRGGYAVYSIRQNGKRISTLGLHKDGNTFTIQQHYGPCNSQIPNEVREFGVYVVEQLNESEK